MRTQRNIKLSEKDKQDIENLIEDLENAIEELEKIQGDVKRICDNWSVKSLEGAKIAKEGQKINRDLTQGIQKCEESKNALAEYIIIHSDNKQS